MYMKESVGMSYFTLGSKGIIPSKQAYENMELANELHDAIEVYYASWWSEETSIEKFEQLALQSQLRQQIHTPNKNGITPFIAAYNCSINDDVFKVLNSFNNSI